MGQNCVRESAGPVAFWNYVKSGPSTGSPLVGPPGSLPKASEGGLTVATWNVAAINNNPFEYWITHDDPLYIKLMQGVEDFIEGPGDRDVPVSELFSDEMFAEFKALMVAEGWEGVDAVDKQWKDNYRSRKIVSGFMKDKDIGLKRLASMPDRVTNTISVAGAEEPVCRPTIVNNYVGALPSLAAWWPIWRDFMFKNELQIEAKGKVSAQRPCKMLGMIKRAKYPAVTEEEEKISIPLQCLCLAIFDAILVHMMVTLSPDGLWQNVKTSIVDAVFRNKSARTIEILKTMYSDVDIICLQESAADFKDSLEKELGHTYHVIAPADADPSRDQNSMILLSKTKFPTGTHTELTKEALANLEDSALAQRGDLCVVAVQDAAGNHFLVATFHGDTNGLATKPVVSAVQKLMAKQPEACRSVFCLDANVYLKKKEGMQDVADFLSHCKSLGLRTWWEEDADPAEYPTCCTARTYVQPQFNKAVRSADKLTKGDMNPKDHILFERSAYEVADSHRDNTGNRKYLENTVFPTLRFPSDHGIVFAVLTPCSAKL